MGRRHKEYSSLVLIFLANPWPVGLAVMCLPVGVGHGTVWYVVPSANPMHSNLSAGIGSLMFRPCNFVLCPEPVPDFESLPCLAHAPLYLSEL